MKCLRCGERQEPVVAIDLSGVPHGTAGHNVMYDWTTVLSCPGCGYGEVRHHSHDCWSDPWDEEWDMTWSTQLPPAPLALLRQGMATCPAPADPACECTAHASLRETRRRMSNLLLGRDGTRPDGGVLLRDDGVPEFVG